MVLYSIIGYWNSASFGSWPISILVHPHAYESGNVTKSLITSFYTFHCHIHLHSSFLNTSAGTKNVCIQNQGVGYETLNLIMTFSITTSGVLYVILSSLVLRKHRTSIANEFSFTEKINLAWLQYLIYGIGMIWILVIIGNDDWIFGAVVLFIFFIGYFGIRQVGIFHLQEVHSPNNKAEAHSGNLQEIESKPNPNPVSYQEQELFGEEKRKYKKSGLSAESAEILHRQLTQVMRDGKHYCESELSLTELAGQLNTQPNYLSQVINEREGKNFYDYINTLRIEEFKRLAASPDSRKYTLLALAQHCGFNSKSSFNRCFKKVTGQSPSAFVLAVSGSEK